MDFILLSTFKGVDLDDDPWTHPYPREHGWIFEYVRFLYYEW